MCLTVKVPKNRVPADIADCRARDKHAEVQVFKPHGTSPIQAKRSHHFLPHRVLKRQGRWNEGPENTSISRQGETTQRPLGSVFERVGSAQKNSGLFTKNTYSGKAPLSPLGTWRRPGEAIGAAQVAFMSEPVGIIELILSERRSLEAALAELLVR